MSLRVRLTDTIGALALDIDFTAPAAGVIGLFGPSGAGKTTILRAIAGLNRRPGAFVSLGDEVWQDTRRFVPPHRRRTALVFQDSNLFPHLSVRANLTYGQSRAAPAHHSIAFDDVVTTLALGALLDRAPDGLSGGERQRVAIGRALLSQPRLLLLDEPVSALDRAGRDEIMEVLEKLCRGLAIPVVYVSHDLTEMTRLADHLVLIGNGRVRADGKLADLLADLSLPLAGDPQGGTILDAMVTDYDGAYGLSTVSVAGGHFLVPGQIAPACRLRVLASDVGLCRTVPEGTTILNTPAGRILEAAPHGAHQVNVLVGLGEQAEGAKLLARITRRSWDSLGLKPGDPVHALVKSVSLVG